MSEKYSSRMLDQFPIRFPEGMRDKIKVMAAQNRRSMNAEIVMMLEKQIRTTETQKADAA